MVAVRLLLLFINLILAFMLRLYAVYNMYPFGGMDVDEFVYLPIVVRYSRYIGGGDLNALLLFDENIEHPVFAKLLFALTYLVFDGTPLYTCRFLSVFFSC